jgi:hypothetical protein
MQQPVSPRIVLPERDLPVQRAGKPILWRLRHAGADLHQRQLECLGAMHRRRHLYPGHDDRLHEWDGDLRQDVPVVGVCLPDRLPSLQRHVRQYTGQRPDELRGLRAQMCGRHDLPERRLHVRRDLDADLRQLRNADADLPRRNLVGLVGVWRRGPVRPRRHAVVWDECRPELRRHLSVGKLHLQHGLQLVQQPVRQRTDGHGQLWQVRQRLPDGPDLPGWRLRLSDGIYALSEQLREREDRQRQLRRLWRFLLGRDDVPERRVRVSGRHEQL